jgi:hypothetical protein
MFHQPDSGALCADDEQTDLEYLEGFECPDGCDFLDVLTPDDALALVVADPMLCLICDRELEQTNESLRDLVAYVDESTSNADA